VSGYFLFALIQGIGKFDADQISKILLCLDMIVGLDVVQHVAD
jgi:hypothetical protein